MGSQINLLVMGKFDFVINRYIDIVDIVIVVQLCNIVI